MQNITAILFDFDGVIMDSMHLKLESYCFALQKYQFSRSDIERIQLRLAGLSRHEVMSSIVKELNGESPSIKGCQALSERFANHDESSVPKMSPVVGTIEFLEKISPIYFTAIVTGTPQSSIEWVTEVHNLNRFFNSINGSPETKSEIIYRLHNSKSLKPDEVIFIGDGKTDQEAANTCGIRFIGLERKGASFDTNSAWKVVNDLNELLPILTGDD